MERFRIKGKVFQKAATLTVSMGQVWLSLLINGCDHAMKSLSLQPNQIFRIVYLEVNTIQVINNSTVSTKLQPSPSVHH